MYIFQWFIFRLSRGKMVLEVYRGQDKENLPHVTPTQRPRMPHQDHQKSRRLFSPDPDDKFKRVVRREKALRPLMSQVPRASVKYTQNPVPSPPAQQFLEKTFSDCEAYEDLSEFSGSSSFAALVRGEPRNKQVLNIIIIVLFNVNQVSIVVVHAWC